MNTYDNIPTVSADIASGLHADTGKVLGCAVRAAATVTFSLAKPGQFIDQGALYTGRLMVRDIGIPGDVMVAQALNVETIDATVVKETLPMRKADGHKGDFGKDYILGRQRGLYGRPGAGGPCVCPHGGGTGDSGDAIFCLEHRGGQMSGRDALSAAGTGWKAFRGGL